MSFGTEHLHRRIQWLSNKLNSIENLLINVCEDYGSVNCQEDVCDCDPNGWKGCLTRKILEIIQSSAPSELE